jgi:C4-dicarboxylate-specific signal transduction histidine kinase
MSISHQTQSTGPQVLRTQLVWLIRLRWLAGFAMALAGWSCCCNASLCAMGGHILLLAVGILIYNTVLLVVKRKWLRQSRHGLLVLACVQILLDLLCLALLVSWTGGLSSPVLGFFVFHMIFASLLLSRRLAYASALAAVVLLSAALAWTGQWPRNNAQAVLFIGTALTFLLTVTFTNHITRDLRRHRRRLVRQNRRIRAMSNRLRKNQQAMILQEKMVALGQMAAGVAHEVTNPLANMDTLLQLAQRNPHRLNEQTIKTLREQIARLNSIVHQMRSFAHPTVGDLQRLPLNEVVSKAVDLIKMDGRAKKLSVDTHLANEVGLAEIRPQAMQQVLVNLMLNALDAMADSPTPRLIVRTSRREDSYLIEITDSGIGIKPKHMKHLFEPFFTTKPVGKGTGLGLSISYNLIEIQGGFIDVQSKVGEGTTMIIHLPAPKVADAAISTEVAAAEKTT